MKGHVGTVSTRQYLNGAWSLLVKWKFSGQVHGVSADLVNAQLLLEDTKDLHAVVVDLVSSCCYKQAHFGKCEDDCDHKLLLWKHEEMQRGAYMFVGDALRFYGCAVHDKACERDGFCPIDTHRSHLRTLRAQNKFSL